MKKVISICLFLFFWYQINAQEIRDSASIPYIDTLNIISNPQIEATFPGGNRELKKFILKNIDSVFYEEYYSTIKRPKKGLWEIVSTRFETAIDLIIDKDGKIYNINFKNPSWVKIEHAFINKEFVRVLLLSQPWTPALQNNVPIKSKKTINVSVNLTFDSKFRRQYFAHHPEYH